MGTRRSCMESDSGYREKMDALDLIMNALRDHEKQLDELAHRLEQAFKAATTGASSPRDVAPEPQQKEPPPRRRGLHVVLRKWPEFKRTCQDASIVAFEVDDNRFHIDAVKDEGVFTYEEVLPKTAFKVVEESSRLTIDRDAFQNTDAFRFLIEGRLACGLNLTIHSASTRLNDRESLVELRYGYESDAVKVFLSREIGIPKDRILEGTIAT